MSKKKLLAGIISLVIYTAIIALAFYLIGYKTAYDRIENSASSSQTFYAEISEIRGNVLSVKGMEINDANFRGDFFFSVDAETKITWRGTEISLDDLAVGDNISITFTGVILEMYPAQITQVTAIQQLEDE